MLHERSGESCCTKQSIGPFHKRGVPQRSLTHLVGSGGDEEVLGVLVIGQPLQAARNKAPVKDRAGPG
jgi:hypothetical protein